MIVKGELDELVDTLNDYSVYLKQFGYDIDTIFAAYAIMAASLSGKKIKKNASSDAIKERMKELNVVQTRTSGTVHQHIPLHQNYDVPKTYVLVYTYPMSDPNGVQNTMVLQADQIYYVEPGYHVDDDYDKIVQVMIDKEFDKRSQQYNLYK